MGRDIEIVRLAPERWREYRALRLEALADTPAAFGSSYATSVTLPDDYWHGRLRQVAEGRNLLLFARHGDNLAGMIGAIWGPDGDGPGLATIVSVFVRPAYRGRGIGDRLLDAALRAAAAIPGLHTARLNVSAEQPAAIGLYLRAGFEVIGSERSLMGDGVERDELIMERRL